LGSIITREVDVIAFDHGKLRRRGIPHPTPLHHRSQTFLDKPLALRQNSYLGGDGIAESSRSHDGFPFREMGAA